MEEGQRQRQACIIGSSHGCLNPCCNGRGSKTLPKDVSLITEEEVLILVVMEEGRRPATRACPGPRKEVLILVVMEEGRRRETAKDILLSRLVLILVVMEEGRRQSSTDDYSAYNVVLILVVMEEGQRRLRMKFLVIAIMS